MDTLLGRSATAGWRARARRRCGVLIVRGFAALGMIVLPHRPASAQLVSDTLFTWSGYARESICRVRIFRAAPRERKEYVVVLDELAENRGPSILDDARLLAELIGRDASVDPESAYWVFRWGDFSFEGAAPSRKEMLFRAMFRRADSGGLGAPSWRLITREMLMKYTDRAFP